MIVSNEEMKEMLGEEEYKRLETLSKLRKNEQEDRAKRLKELMNESVSEERLDQINQAIYENSNEEEEVYLDLTKEEALAAGFEPETISQEEYEELERKIKSGEIKFVKV